MQQFLVSIELESGNLSLREISDALGVRCSRGSEESVEVRGQAVAIWRLRSTASRSATLASHLRNVFGRIDFNRWSELWKRLVGKATLRVGILYDGAMALVEIPAELLVRAAQMGLAIEVSCYPSRFDGVSAVRVRKKPL